MGAAEEWEVSPPDSGIKLLVFIKRFFPPSYSNRQLKQVIENGSCQVNGRTERFASRQLGAGDRVKCERLEPLTQSKEEILFSDEWLSICNKQAGVVSEPQNFTRGKPVHRLDKDTTGLLILAKNPDAEGALLDIFKQRKMIKHYLALVDGIPKNSTGVVENYLGKKKIYQGQSIWGTVSQEKGLYAKTDWKILQRGSQACLIECQPETGRTHQIRVHMSEIGHPILGDYQYGRQFKCPYRPSRTLLHASNLAFVHPFTNQRIEISAPLPEDFKLGMANVL